MRLTSCYSTHWTGGEDVKDTSGVNDRCFKMCQVRVHFSSLMMEKELSGRSHP